MKLHNHFKMEDAHPTHVRFATFHMLVTSDARGSMPVLINIKHEGLVDR